MVSEEITFQNPEGYRGSNKSVLSFKQIILMHINRCVTNGSVEWKGGYWEHKIKGDHTEDSYVPDTRDVYRNSVNMLRALLSCYFDKDKEDKTGKDKDKSIIEKADKEIQDKLKELRDKIRNTDSKNKVKIQRLYYKRVELSVRLFEELVKLSKRLNFFEEEGEIDEM